MKTLIIYAHPNIEGHCSTILKNVEKELKARKEKYELLDLYKLKFNPILPEDELYSSGRKKESKEVKLIQSKITESDKLIFIYPIWWNNCPAILKGFIDRIFSSGFGFRYEKNKLGMTLPKGKLGGKKAIVFTTSGSPNFLFKCILGARGSKILTKDTLSFCGIKAKSFHHGSARKLTPESEAKLERLVKKGIKWMY